MIWYLLGVIFVLSVYPVDVAVVSILMYVFHFLPRLTVVLNDTLHSLAFADTAASTIGRLWGSLTPPLPRYLPIIGFPLAPRKSLAGFMAATVAGAAVVAGFWGWSVTLGVADPLWTWNEGLVEAKTGLLSGWIGLGVISIVSGLISGVAEALGEFMLSLILLLLLILSCRLGLS